MEGAPAGKRTKGETADAKVEERVQRDLGYLEFTDEYTLVVKKGLVPNMRVEGRIFVSKALGKMLLDEIRFYHINQETSFLPAVYQIGNAAALPGIVNLSLGLPDIHAGYGFAIGHVAAFDMDDPQAIVSPGGVGFDINCGVRMLRSNLTIDQLRPHQQTLTDEIFAEIPVGVGGRRKTEVGLKELRCIMEDGMEWAVRQGFAWPEDPENCEERGRIPLMQKLSPSPIPQRAEAKGRWQLGTLGSGNHYIEVQAVTDIYDDLAARAMGISQVGQVCVMIHCGSRGLGHDVANSTTVFLPHLATNCVEYIERMKKSGIPLNDDMLACDRIASPAGQEYLAAMAGACNFAYVNRSVIATGVRNAFERVFGQSARDLDLHTIYDVSHNIAKVEEHEVGGHMKRLLVHRKGSTRAFPPGHPDLPPAYKSIGQPVMVGGSMGTCSYVLTGTATGMRQTFGSTCHGAGRALARSQVITMLTPAQVLDNLASKNICVRVGSPDNIAEEAPEAYKDVTNVVDLCDSAGISKKAFRLEPLCVIKG